MNYRMLCAILVYALNQAMVMQSMENDDQRKFLTMSTGQLRKWKQKQIGPSFSIGRTQGKTSSTAHVSTIFNQSLNPQQATYKLMQTIQALRNSNTISQQDIITISGLLDAQANPYAIMITYKELNDTIAHKILELVISSGNLKLLEHCLEKKVNFKVKVSGSQDTPYSMVLKVSKMNEIKEFKHASEVIQKIDSFEKKI
jgi:hypothetical protein